MEDDDLPPLEEVKEDDKISEPAKASAAPSTDETSKESVGGSASRATPVFNYSDEDDENESAASNAPSQSASTQSAQSKEQAVLKKVQYTKSTDLEELD